MATQDQLHGAFIDWSTTYLNSTDSASMDPKIFDCICKYLDKREYSNVETPIKGSMEESKLAKLKDKVGVKE